MKSNTSTEIISEHDIWILISAHIRIDLSQDLLRERLSSPGLSHWIRLSWRSQWNNIGKTFCVYKYAHAHEKTTVYHFRRCLWTFLRQPCYWIRDRWLGRASLLVTRVRKVGQLLLFSASNNFHCSFSKPHLAKSDSRTLKALKFFDWNIILRV